MVNQNCTLLNQPKAINQTATLRSTCNDILIEYLILLKMKVLIMTIVLKQQPTCCHIMPVLTRVPHICLYKLLIPVTYYGQRICLKPDYSGHYGRITWQTANSLTLVSGQRGSLRWDDCRLIAALLPHCRNLCSRVDDRRGQLCWRCCQQLSNTILTMHLPCTHKQTINKNILKHGMVWYCRV